MMGGMLAGHDQSGGEVMEKNGKKVKYHDKIIKFQREGADEVVFGMLEQQP